MCNWKKKLNSRYRKIGKWDLCKVFSNITSNFKTKSRKNDFLVCSFRKYLHKSYWKCIFLMLIEHDFYENWKTNNFRNIYMLFQKIAKNTLLRLIFTLEISSLKCKFIVHFPLNRLKLRKNGFSDNDLFITHVNNILNVNKILYYYVILRLHEVMHRTVTK